MNYKKTFFIVILIFSMLLSVSAVSASGDAADMAIADDSSVDTGLADKAVDDSTEGLDDGQGILAESADEQDNLEATTTVSTSVTVNSVTANEGDSFTFTATVKATNGMTPPGNVTFKYGNSANSVALDSKGIVKITYEGTFSPGSYSWSASYGGGSTTSGSTTYKFSTSSKTFTLNVYGNATVTASDFNIFYQSGEKYRIKAVDRYSGKSIAGKKMKIMVYLGESLDTTLIRYTDDNGVVEDTFYYPIGNYNIIASLDDTHYNSNNASFNIAVAKAPVNLIVSEITGTYPYVTLKATVKDTFNNYVYDGVVRFVINGKTYAANVVDGEATKKVELPQGTYNCAVSYEGSNYYSNGASFKAVVKKAGVKIIKHPWISTTKQYATLKVLIKDQYGKKVNEGTVKFKINGKSYKVKVKNGVATKKIKLRKAKVYKLKSTFSSNNFNTKTASSKVYVKKAKKWYKFKVGKLVGKISYKQYTKLLKCHNEGKYKEITIKTGKYKTYKVPKYTYKKVKKSKWKYKKVLSYEEWGDAYGRQWEEYDDWEYYTNHGWTWYATSYDDNDYDDGSFYYATYYKLKKKVKVTVKKKVQNGYKTAKYPIRMYVFCSDLYDGFGVGFYDNYEGYLGSKSLSIKKF